jgi:hypothetical protein
MRHRGTHPEDEELFSAAALPRLRRAATEIGYLLSRGYPLEPALDFVAGRYQLLARQRLALRRVVCSDAQRLWRSSRLLPHSAAQGGRLHIDGFNLIITLEVALAGGVLFRGFDGALRDLAGLRGTYHLVEETDAAVRLLFSGCAALAAPGVTLYLDAPVSNSGRLRARVLELAEACGVSIPIDVELAADVDRSLVACERVVTSDSMVLDACASWLNLHEFLLFELLEAPDARRFSLVDFREAAATPGRD